LSEIERVFIVISNFRAKLVESNHHNLVQRCTHTRCVGCVHTACQDIHQLFCNRFQKEQPDANSWLWVSVRNLCRLPTRHAQYTNEKMNFLF